MLSLGAVLLVAVKLKVLTMPFFIVPFQHRFGVFGQIILFTLMASTNPFLIPQYSFSLHPMQLFRTWSFSLPSLGLFGLTEIRLCTRILVYFLFKCENWQKMFLKILLVRQLGILANLEPPHPAGFLLPQNSTR